MLFKIRNLGAVAAFCLVLSGCATPSLKVSMEPDELLNQDADGNSYSVLVRLYQLNDPALFEATDVGTLFRQDSSALGATVLDQKEVLVAPGVASSIVMPRLDGVTHLGAVAFYRSADTERQKILKALNDGHIKFSSKLELILEGNSLSDMKVIDDNKE